MAKENVKKSDIKKPTMFGMVFTYKKLVLSIILLTVYFGFSWDINNYSSLFNWKSA